MKTFFGFQNVFRAKICFHVQINVFVCYPVDSVVESLKCCVCDQHGLGSEPTRIILLCPWERHFTALSPAWMSWQAVLNLSHVFMKLKKQNKKFERTAISWHLRKQVWIIACPIY